MIAIVISPQFLVRRRYGYLPRAIAGAGVDRLMSLWQLVASVARGRGARVTHRVPARTLDAVAKAAIQTNPPGRASHAARIREFAAGSLFPWSRPLSFPVARVSRPTKTA